LPFLGEFLGNAFEDSFCFSCKDAISRGYEGGKVPALGLAGFEVLPLLVIFLLPQDLLIVFVPVGCTIEVNNGYINDAVSTTGEEVSEKEVTPLMRRSWGAGLVWGVACDPC
jgi:hypothetical protein